MEIDETKYNTKLLQMIRAVNTEKIAEDICSVQPMSSNALADFYDALKKSIIRNKKTR